MSISWIEQNVGYRYIPATGDQVVGIVEDKSADYYRINIFGSSNAFLHRVNGFEGATKRNKPELRKGSVVYVVISSSDSHAEIEATCISNNSFGQKRDWNSGETIYGELPEGHILHVPSSLCRYMLFPDNKLLNSLGSHMPFEIVIGLNGVVWIKASGEDEKTSLFNHILLRNAIMNAAYLIEEHGSARVRELGGADDTKDDCDAQTFELEVTLMVEKLFEAAKKLKEQR